MDGRQYPPGSRLYGGMDRSGLLRYIPPQISAKDPKKDHQGELHDRIERLLRRGKRRRLWRRCPSERTTNDRRLLASRAFLGAGFFPLAAVRETSHRHDTIVVSVQVEDPHALGVAADLSDVADLAAEHLALRRHQHDFIAVPDL